MQQELSENFIILDHKRKVIRSVAIELNLVELKKGGKIYFQDKEISKKNDASEHHSEIYEREDLGFADYIHICPKCRSFQLELVMVGLWD